MFQDSEGALVPPKIYLGMVPSVEGQSKQYAGRRREMLNPGTGNFRVSRAAIAMPLADLCLEPTPTKVKVHSDPDWAWVRETGQGFSGRLE